MPAPFVLDCDTGIDDALAILYLLSDPAAEVLAITSVFGNASVQQTAANTLGLLELVGRSEIPVSIGADHPLTMPFGGGAHLVHGSNGVGGVVLPTPTAAPTGEHAVDTIVRLARENPGQLNLIAVAPLTNIALALRAEPRLPELVGSLTIMGGAALAPGNVSPVAEANIRDDPEAAAEVFAADWKITLVPLDVTMTHLLEESDRQQLIDSGRPVGAVLAEMLSHYFDFYTEVFGRRCSALHDPLAVAIATGSVRPALAPWVPVVVDATQGPGRGQTIADMRGKYRNYPPRTTRTCRVVLTLDAPFTPTLMSRLHQF